MPTIQVEAQVSARELLKAAEQMSLGELETFVADVIALRNRRTAPTLSTGEEELLRRIYQPLPADVQSRYDALVARRRAGTLTPQEHAELLQLTDRVENHAAARVQALGELARLRGVSLPQVMDQLGIKAPPIL